MDYVSQINGFWEKSSSDSLKSIDVSVYMAILNYCRSLNWTNPFILRWEIICQYSKCSKNAFYASIKRLNELNYIDYHSGERNVLQPKIVVLQFENRTKNRKGTERRTEREQHFDLSPLLSPETVDIINNNADLVNSNIEKWVKKEIEHKKHDQPVTKTNKPSTPEKKKPSIDEKVWELYEIYQKHCPHLRGMRKVNEQKRKLTRKLLKDYNFQDFEEAVQKGAMLPFLNGKGSSGWKADFEFFLNPTKLGRVLEGKYDNAHNYNRDPKTISEGERLMKNAEELGIDFYTYHGDTKQNEQNKIE